MRVVDVWDDALEIASLIVGIGAGLGAWFNWRRLKSDEA
jgi:hypothetical protein